METATKYQHTAHSSATQLREFFESHLDGITNAGHASSIIIGLLQMLKSTAVSARFGQLPINNEAQKQMSDICHMLFIPGVENNQEKLWFCTLKKLQPNPKINNADTVLKTSGIQNPALFKTIVLSTGEEVILGEVKSIVRCEASENGLMIFFQNNLYEYVNISLDEIMCRMDGGKFVRINHEELINTIHICKYYTHNGLLLMQDGHKTIVAKSKKQFFLQSMMVHGLNKRSTYGSRSNKK